MVAAVAEVITTLRWWERVDVLQPDNSAGNANRGIRLVSPKTCEAYNLRAKEEPTRRLGRFGRRWNATKKPPASTGPRPAEARRVYYWKYLGGSCLLEQVPGLPELFPKLAHPTGSHAAHFCHCGSRFTAR